MAVLTFFLWSHEDSDSYWDFKLWFAICQIAEVAKLMSLITFCQHFCDMEVFFGTLTNSIALLLLKLPSWISETLPPSILCHLNQLAGYGWTCICWDKTVTTYLSENVKIFCICTLVLNIWVTFHELRRNILFSWYCWWVLIIKATFTAILNIKLRCSERYEGFRALTMNVMSSGMTLICEILFTWPKLVIALLSTYLLSLSVLLKVR